MVSVLIPTYKRLPFLKRAIEDVFAQTYKDWELVVTDDEVCDGETWQWLCELTKNDSRVHAVKNFGPKHGQVFNVNSGLRQCRGDWIKVLFDDDRMLPECIEKMIAVVDHAEQLKFHLAMVGCRAQKWRDGKYTGDEEDFAKGTVEVIPSDLCRLAICKYDRWNGRTPTHMLIRRDAILAGALMPEDGRYDVPVDVVWFADILDHGDYAMMPDVLVHQREGEVRSITGDARDEESALDNELFLAYHDVYDRLSDLNKRKLSWSDVESEINGIRGIYHLKCHRFLLGLKMICRMLLSPFGTFLTLRWLLQKTFPKHFSATKRVSL